MVRIVGEASEFARSSDVGNSVTSGFCPSCGSTIYVQLEKNPGFTGVPVGAFGESNFPSLDNSVWEQEKHHWVEFPESVSNFVKGTDRA